MSHLVPEGKKRFKYQTAKPVEDILVEEAAMLLLLGRNIRNAQIRHTSQRIPPQIQMKPLFICLL